MLILIALELGVHLGLACHCGRCDWGRRLGAEADLDAPGKLKLLQSECEFAANTLTYPAGRAPAACLGGSCEGDLLCGPDPDVGPHRGEMRRTLPPICGSPPPFTRPALTPLPGLPHSIIEEMRRFMEFPFDVPHEAFARQHAENPEAFVVQPHHRAQLPPGFWSHEVVFATQNIF